MGSRLEEKYYADSIINKWYILTAAHCVYYARLKPWRIIVHLGSDVLDEGFTRTVADVRIHENYSGGRVADIATLKLQRSV